MMSLNQQINQQAESANMDQSKVDGLIDNKATIIGAFLQRPYTDVIHSLKGHGGHDLLMAVAHKALCLIATTRDEQHWMMITLQRPANVLQKRLQLKMQTLNLIEAHHKHAFSFLLDGE